MTQTRYPDFAADVDVIIAAITTGQGLAELLQTAKKDQSGATSNAIGYVYELKEQFPEAFEHYKDAFLKKNSTAFANIFRLGAKGFQPAKEKLDQIAKLTSDKFAQHPNILYSAKQPAPATPEPTQPATPKHNRNRSCP